MIDSTAEYQSSSLDQFCYLHHLAGGREAGFIERERPLASASAIGGRSACLLAATPTDKVLIGFAARYLLEQFAAVRFR